MHVLLFGKPSVAENNDRSILKTSAGFPHYFLSDIDWTGLIGFISLMTPSESSFLSTLSDILCTFKFHYFYLMYLCVSLIVLRLFFI